MEVRVDGLRFFRGRRLVLDVPSLAFAGRRTTALLGPNGAGKSTLLRLIAGLEEPGGGSVTVGGMAALGARRSRNVVSYAFQEPVFLAGSVRANLDLGLRLRGLDQPARAARVREAADACGIANLLDRSAQRLSGGEAQRASLARALCLRAPLTLLDEPLTGLDGPARRQLLHDLPRLLREFATTTILVTHDRDEALRIADDLVVLIAGHSRAAGPKADVIHRPPDPETAAFLGYTVIPTDAGLMAVAPGALRPGPGDVQVDIAVEDVIDLATHREVSGLAGNVRVVLPLPPGHPDPGPVLLVSAPAASVIHFPGPS